MCKNLKLNYRYIFCLALLIAVTIFLTQALFIIKQRNIIPVDDPSYYFSYVRSLIIDNDLDFTNEYNYFGITDYAFTPVGKLSNFYSIGFPILVLPFYAITHYLVLFFNMIGLSVISDGYSKVYQITFSLSGIFYGFAGLFICYLFLKEYFSESISSISIIILIITTNLFFYITISPYTSEPYSFFCVTLFVFLWQKTIFLHNKYILFFLGVTAGFMIMVRQQNAAFLILIVIGYISQINSLPMRTIFKEIVLITLGIFLSFLPQIMVWKIIYGSFFVYSYEDASFPYIFEPKILQVLLSTRHGLISWHPIIFICLVGIIISIRSYKIIGFSFFISFIIQLYIISSWWYWSLGYSFGNRGFIGCSSMFAFGMANILEIKIINKNMAIIIIFILTLSAWNIILSLLYLSGIIPIDDYFRWPDLIKNIHMLPERLLERIHSL